MAPPRTNIWSDLSFTENNGIADIREIEISLADNIASDPLMIGGILIPGLA